MFYINRYLKAELTFSHYDMDKLSSDEQILRKLKERVEGRCHPDYGYLIQITKMPGTHSDQGIQISVPKVELNGCVVTVTFSAIAFKPEKNDVIDIIATELSQQFIKGKIGHAEVMIPRSKMPQNNCQYRANENVYIFHDEDANEQIKIDKDSKVRCRCFQIKTELNFQMKIIAKIDQNLISTMHAN